MEVIVASLGKILESMPYFGILLVCLFVAKWFFDLTTPYKFSSELTDKDNPAFGVCLAGYLIGSGIALTGVLFGTNGSIGDDIVGIIIGSVATIVLIRLSVLINDLAILHKFAIHKELIEDRNVGTGFVVAGSCIATGWMLNGVLSGHSESMLLVVRDIIVYWTLGQVILITGGFLFQMITKYDIHKIIGDEDNLPAGISFGGFLVALGIITRSALFGATSNLGEEILVTLIFAVAGMILLVITRIIVDKVFLPNSPLSKEVAVDRNPAAGAVAAASFIIIAALFAAAINPHPPTAQSITDVEIVSAAPDDASLKGVRP